MNLRPMGYEHRASNNFPGSLWRKLAKHTYAGLAFARGASDRLCK
jgi:hypothetical protein